VISKIEDCGVAAAFRRDSNGQYLRASVVVFHGVTDAAILEALACREALALAEDLALDRVFVASDWKTDVNDIRDGTMSCYGSIITEIRARTTIFRKCTFPMKL
jgi:hypothetical protein